MQELLEGTCSANADDGKDHPARATLSVRSIVGACRLQCQAFSHMRRDAITPNQPRLSSGRASFQSQRANQQVNDELPSFEPNSPK